MLKRPLPDLSTYYYWENFNYVLGYVKKHYQNLLSESEIEFVRNFERLSKDSQCLYLRLASRRATWFREEKLKYVEISDISLRLDELKESGFITFASTLETVDLGQILSVFSKQECINVANLLPNFPKFPISISKENLIKLHKFYGLDTFIALDEISKRLISPIHGIHFEFIQFLFFGTKFRDMSEFVIRDLGHRQYMDVNEQDLVPYFQSRKEAVEKWKISLWRTKFYELSKNSDSVYELVQSWNRDVLPLLQGLSQVAIGSFERALFALGRWLERLELLEMALNIYEPSLSGLSFERRVRILFKLRRLEEAIILANVGLELAKSPKELHFFEDFILKQQSKRYVKVVTQSLKSSSTLMIEQRWKGKVELGVINYYKNLGYSAYFTENHLWKNLLGLLCWDLIFDQKQIGIHHPFQWAPSHYLTDAFTIGKEKDFEEKISIMASVYLFKAHALQIIANHKGKSNPLIDWYTLDVALILELLKRVPLDSLATVLRYFWSHLSTHAKGFPDLFIFNQSEYQFIEVKSPTDHLSAIQYFWHDFLIKAGVNTKLMRIVWLD